MAQETHSQTTTDDLPQVIESDVSVSTTIDPQLKGRVLRNFRHGGHVIDPGNSAEAGRATDLASIATSVVVNREPLTAKQLDDGTTPFDYLFEDLEDDADAHLPATDPAATVAALKKLGTLMATEDRNSTVPDSTIPPIYTYWGQFIDHDLTANTDRKTETSDITADPLAPVAPADVLASLRNLREPALNLDSIYGTGPEFPGGPPSESADQYDGIKLKVGTVATESDPGRPPLAGVRIPATEDLARDLPRHPGDHPKSPSKAIIGDGRNDENLAVAQLHVAFLRFHNAVVDWVRANEGKEYTEDEAVFGRARQLVQWHYQWLVLNDFLGEIALPGAADQVLFGGNRYFTPRRAGKKGKKAKAGKKGKNDYQGQVYMPLEYSVAAYRFGHSMVRAAYDYNRNFGIPDPVALNTPVIPSAPFFLLFLFTGNGRPPFGGDTAVLPFNWVIEFDRFVDRGTSLARRFARKIDTRLALPLSDMQNQVEDPTATEAVQTILKALAVRNLLRGYSLSIPTGQAVAAKLGITPLTPEQLKQDNDPGVSEALEEGGFDTKTPLWFYVLKEAELIANGNSLGPVGSTIVCEVIVGQVRYDRESYLNVTGGWSPADGVRFPDGRIIAKIADLIEFAGLPVRL